eukprot:TRINITY_DN31623_c0_g1_i3.p1 TRINITY_DN31623_c0_g1~~TRINITY_DN31623_c0_g1_i3.p1  ORF type:complete len:1033 (-),score=76.03 TRINITY_DN31623_c0_g1_i3:282-3380(-)
MALLMEMEAEQLRRDVVSYNGAVSCCRRGSQWICAAWLLDDLRQEGLAGSVITCSAIAAAYASADSWQKAMMAVRNFGGQSVQVNSIVSNAALNGCSKAGAWTKTLGGLSFMKTEVLSPDKTSFTAAIRATCTGGRWLATVAILRRMALDELAADLVMMSVLVSAFNRARRWSHAVAAVRQRYERGERVDAAIYNAVLGAVGRAGETGLVDQFLIDMGNSATRADVVTHSAVVNSLRSTCNWQGTIAVWVAMVQKAAKVDAAFMRNLLGALSDAVEWRSVLSLLRGMRLDSLQPDMSSRSLSSDGFLSQGLWRRAYFTFVEARDDGIATSASSVGKFVSVSGRAYGWAGAMACLLETRMRCCRADVISLSIVSNACAQTGSWKLVCQLVRSMGACWLSASVVSASVLQTAVAASPVGDDWSRAVMALDYVHGLRLQVDVRSFNSCCSALAQKGQWHMAGDILLSCESVGLQLNSISFNCIFPPLPHAGSGSWRLASCILHTMQRRLLDAHSTTAGAMLTATQGSGQWQLAVALLGEFEKSRLSLTAASYAVALSAAGEVENVDAAWAVFERMRDVCSDMSLSDELWSLARLTCQDEEGIADLSLRALSVGKVTGFGPDVLPKVMWSLSALSARGDELWQCLSSEAAAVVERLDLRALAMMAWALAACDAPVPGIVLRRVGECVARCLGNLDVADLAGRDRKLLAERLRSVLWALSFRGALDAAVLAVIRDRFAALATRRAGARRSRTITTQQLPLPSQRSSSIGSTSPCQGTDDKPQVLADLQEALVVFKPPGWEACDNTPGHEDKQVSSFLQAEGLVGTASQIGLDMEHNYGFLHRIDVPDSGLLLVAKTYRAYYDLTVQLNTGRIKRDYVILCHGFVWRRLKRICKRLWWRGMRPTQAGTGGKPSVTNLKVLGHASRQADAFSLVAIRIVTGRRHQIRCHMQYLGHPTVCDKMYSSAPTYRSDRNWCARNFLHRYFLEFDDTSGSQQTVCSPISESLQDVLRLLEAKDASSQAGMQLFLSASGPPNWVDL